MLEIIVEALIKGITEVANHPGVQGIALYQVFIQAHDSLYGGILGIKERFNRRKFEKFFEQLIKSNLSKNTLDKYLKKANKNKKHLEDICEQIVIFIDRVDYEYKAEMYAKLYIALLEDKIDYEVFNDMLSIIERWMKSDNTQLLAFYEYSKQNKEYENIKMDEQAEVVAFDHIIMYVERCWRLVALGVLTTDITLRWYGNLQFLFTGYGRIMSELILLDKIETGLKHHELNVPFKFENDNEVNP